MQNNMFTTKGFTAAMADQYLKENKIFSGNTMFVNDYLREQPVDVRATIPSGQQSGFVDINRKKPNDMLRLFDIGR